MNGRVKSSAFAVIGTVTGLLWVTSAAAASESYVYYQVGVGAGGLSDAASNSAIMYTNVTPHPSSVQLNSPSLYVGGTLGGGGPGGSGNAFGSANAAPGILGASASASVFAETSVTASTSGSATAKTGGHFYDDATITAGSSGQVLYVTGSLLLSGNMNITAGHSPGAVSEYVQVGGSGINTLGSADGRPSTYYWQLDSCATDGSSCRVKSVTGSVTYSYSPLASQYEIPFAFYAQSGIPFELGYWLEVQGNVSDSFGPCIDSLGGGQCDVYQQTTPGIFEYYSHTLLWNGLNVSLSGFGGTPVAYTVTSASGFDFALPASVPLPAAGWLFGSGLLGLAGVRRKTKNVGR